MYIIVSHTYQPRLNSNVVDLFRRILNSALCMPHIPHSATPPIYILTLSTICQLNLTVNAYHDFVDVFHLSVKRLSAVRKRRKTEVMSKRKGEHQLSEC